MSRPFSTFGRRDGLLLLLLLLRPYCASSTIYTCHLWWSYLVSQCWKINEKVSFYNCTKRVKIQILDEIAT